MCNSLWLHGVYIVHGILQARILEWVAFPFSRGSSQPRDHTQVSTLQADSLPAEPQGKPKLLHNFPHIKMFYHTDNSNTGYPHIFRWGALIFHLLLLLSRVQRYVNPWSAAGQAPLSSTISPRLIRFHWVSDIIQPSHPLPSSTRLFLYVPSFLAEQPLTFKFSKVRSPLLFQVLHHDMLILQRAHLN